MILVGHLHVHRNPPHGIEPRLPVRESKRRFTLVAGILGAVFFLAQFLLPMLVMFLVMFPMLPPPIRARLSCPWATVSG